MIFVHGCFWHRHPGCRFATNPGTRKEFWQRKFKANVARDEKAIERLTLMGWRPLIIWECETRIEDELTRLANEIVLPSCR